MIVSDILLNSLELPWSREQKKFVPRNEEDTLYLDT